MRAILSTFQHTARVFSSQRRLWVPFVIVALIEALGIGLIWLAPHQPFSTLLAPPVRYFFGDRVLHYPYHLWFLFFAMKHTHLIASVLMGAFMTGIACAMVAQLHAGSPLSLREALVSRRVRYGRVVILWVITWGLAKALILAVAQVGSKSPWLVGGAIGATVALQALLVYAIPAAVFERASWWKALWLSVRETLRYPLTTLLAILGPSAALIAFAIACSPANVAQWMAQSAPEVALAFVAARLALWTVADTVMTVAVAHLWWFHRPTASALAGAPSARAHGQKVVRVKEGPAVA